MKLMAITAVKAGNGKRVEPGATFEVDDKVGKTLVASGAAATPENYARAKAASRPDRERIADLEAENTELRTANATLTADLEAAKAELEKSKTPTAPPAGGKDK